MTRTCKHIKEPYLNRIVVLGLKLKQRPRSAHVILDWLGIVWKPFTVLGGGKEFLHEGELDSVSNQVVPHFVRVGDSIPHHWICSC
jgi:hypothetical protein